jgi:hypothetical protein
LVSAVTATHARLVASKANVFRPEPIL